MEEARRSQTVTLSEFLRGEGIEIFSFLPLSVLPVIKARMLARVPEARTAVLFAVPYLVREEAERGSNLSVYARSRDYHLYARELGERLTAFWRERFPSSRVCVFADNSPFDEVTAAALGGLGVRGDNGLLITEKYGSYVFIAEAVTDLDGDALPAEGIPRGTGEIRTCGHCRACARACVGHCLPAPDRGNCLSAVTQKKGDLTAEERAAIAASPTVWGCDVCQAVCPLNRTAEQTPIAFFREKRLASLTREHLLTMSEEEYGQYAFSWRKREVLLRNFGIKENEINLFNKQ